MDQKNTSIPKKYIARFAVGFVILGILVAVVIGGLSAKTASTTVTKSASTVQQQQAETISYTGEKGKTALAQLKSVAKNVATKSSTYGEYVDAIGTLQGGQDGKYWTFYIDGTMATVGADAYIAKGGEAFVWKFEKLQ